MRNPFFVLIPVVLLMGAAGCDRRSQPVADHSHEEPSQTPTNRIDIPATVRNNLGITFAKVERRVVGQTVRVPGSFEPKPLARREYRVLAPAHVELLVDQFTRVDPGTHLFRFNAPAWTGMQSRIRAAVTGERQAALRLRAARDRLDALTDASIRRADLEAETLVLQSEYARHSDELASALTEAANFINSFRAPAETPLTTDELLVDKLVDGRAMPTYESIRWIDVMAMSGGVVETIHVTDGSFVEEAGLVLTTVDPTGVRFVSQGLQSDLGLFLDRATARIIPGRQFGADANEAIEATLMVGLAADPVQRTVTLLAEPQSPPSWARAGVSGFLEIAGDGGASPVLAIPRSAVVRDGITHVFFKRDPMDPNKAIRVEADLGADDGHWIEIRSDLGPNDEVVLDGAFELKLASSQSGTARKGGHFHADGTFHADH